jgi:hypothetical protein
LLAGKNFKPKIDEPQSHRRIGKCFHGRRIEPADWVGRRQQAILGRNDWDADGPSTLSFRCKLAISLRIS